MQRSNRWNEPFYCAGMSLNIHVLVYCGGTMSNKLEKATDRVFDCVMPILLCMLAIVSIVGCGGLILLVGWAVIRGIL